MPSWTATPSLSSLSITCGNASIQAARCPLGNAPTCQCLCYHTDDRSISRRLGQWRDMANAAVDILEQLQEGAHDYLWSEVAEIIEDRQVLTDVVDKFYLDNEGD